MRSAWSGLAGALLIAGCASASGPPRIAIHSPCASCGMSIEDPRFACERRVGAGWRAYDAIECLLRDMKVRPGGNAWLPDYDQATLHSGDSLWVVKGQFPTPMSGGFAAFMNRATADSIATATRGTVDRLAAFAEASEP